MHGYANPAVEQSFVRTTVGDRSRGTEHHRQGNLEAVFWT
jgi:hypothetical protein